MILSRTRAMTASAAAVAVVAIAGCGGSNQTAQYKKDVQNIGNQLQAQEKQVEGGSGSPAQKITQFQALFNKAADQFSKLNPPSNAKSSNDQLVTELRGAATDTGQVAAALSSGDAAKAQQLAQKLQGQDVSGIQTTLNDLKKKVGG